MEHISSSNVAINDDDRSSGVAAYMKAKAEIVIGLAARHADLNDSARLSLADAKVTLERGRYEDAYGRAMTSLCHSVGVFHGDYQTGKSL